MYNNKVTKMTSLSSTRIPSKVIGMIHTKINKDQPCLQQLCSKGSYSKGN